MSLWEVPIGLLMAIAMAAIVRLYLLHHTRERNHR